MAKSKSLENFGLPIYCQLDDENGSFSIRVSSEREKSKRQRANRAEVIALLGLDPEGKAEGDKYVGTTRQLWVDYRADRRERAGRRTRERRRSGRADLNPDRLCLPKASKVRHDLCMPYPIRSTLAALFACAAVACAPGADVDAEPVAVAAAAYELGQAADLPAPEPHRYTVYLASDESRAVAAVGDAMERLNAEIGYDAFVWGAGAGEPGEWTVTIKLEPALDGTSTTGVAAGDGSWCDMALAPKLGLTRFVVQHELGHCFDLDHVEQRDSWLYYAPDHRTDVIPAADVEFMRERLAKGW